MNRCPWGTINPQMIKYHDTEWGAPTFSDKDLFRALVLDSFQPGLSWAIILAKRENFKKAFSNFQPEKIAKYDKKKARQLLQDSGIIRNRLKIRATIANAKAFLAVQKEYATFANYFWKFANKKPIQNRWKKQTDIPNASKLSETISKDMKKRGFRFVGPTTIYAYMQGTGMVNDHLVSCFRHQQVRLQ